MVEQHNNSLERTGDAAADASKMRITGSNAPCRGRSPGRSARSRYSADPTLAKSAIVFVDHPIPICHHGCPFRGMSPEIQYVGGWFSFPAELRKRILE